MYAIVGIVGVVAFVEGVKAQNLDEVEKFYFCIFTCVCTVGILISLVGRKQQKKQETTFFCFSSTSEICFYSYQRDLRAALGKLRNSRRSSCP